MAAGSVPCHRIKPLTALALMHRLQVQPHGMAFQVPLTQAVQARESTRHPDRMAVQIDNTCELLAAMFVLTPTRAGR